jgi:hypothetical protein
MLTHLAARSAASDDLMRQATCVAKRLDDGE